MNLKEKMNLGDGPGTVCLVFFILINIVGVMNLVFDNDTSAFFSLLLISLPFFIVFRMTRKDSYLNILFRTIKKKFTSHKERLKKSLDE